MNRMPALASTMLVSTAFLLCILCLPSAVAEPEFNQSLEKIKDFHDRFKDPSFLSRGSGDLSLSAGLANEASLLGGSAWQMGCLVAVDADKRMGIANDRKIEPSSIANSLDIDVSRITVIAINMAKGGNAVATSDIVLNPVQYLGFSTGAEVDEKLK